jgi:hypothetical protein
VNTDSASTSELLAALADGQLGEHAADFDLDELLAQFRRRAFGVLLLVVVLPVLLPIPFGIGALCGPLVCLVGLQLALRLRRPWLPRRLLKRRWSRASFARFLSRMQPWLRRLERLSRPRMDALFAVSAANIVTGLLLIAMGVLLSLPIPLTNYPFGLLILSYAFALIERDGALLLIAWLLSSVAIVVTGLASGEIAAWLGGLF